MKLPIKIKTRNTIIFVSFYLILFSILALRRLNYEFFFYNIIIAIIVFILYKIHKEIHLSTGIITGLIIAGVLHILGGNVHIGATRLYDFWIINGLIRYDNLVHMFSIFVATLIAYNLISPYINYKIKKDWFYLSSLLILIALGIGVLNEIIELLAVLFLNASETVGGYMNNAMDLVFNLIGSVIASIYIWFHYEKDNIEKRIKEQTRRFSK
jgi:hypothetical protein